MIPWRSPVRSAGPARARHAGRAAALAIVSFVLGSAGTALGQADPLPSWNDGPAKRSIVKFVQAVTDAASPQHVPPEK
jgi:hypothetical protein